MDEARAELHRANKEAWALGNRLLVAERERDELRARLDHLRSAYRINP